MRILSVVLSLLLLFLSGGAPLVAQVPTPALSFTPSPPSVVSPVVEASGNSSSTLSLEEVVVTANRLDTPASQVTDSMSVVTSKDIERKQSNTVLNAVEDVPGLELVQNGNPGQTSSVFIRGNDPQHSLVLLDGIPLNDPAGAPFAYDYLDGLDPGDVKQIEVVRGPQSTLWGSNAIGGVINIIPQEGPAPLGGSVRLEGGSYGTSHEALSTQGGDGKGYFNFNASHFNTAGFPSLSVQGLDATDAALEPSNAGSVSNGDDNNTASLRFGSSLAPNLEEKVLVRYSQSNTSVDSYNTAVINSGTVTVSYLADNPGYFALQKQFMVDSRSDWKLLGGIWEQSLGLDFSDDNRLYNGAANAYNNFSDQGNYDGQTAQVNWQNGLHLLKEETLVVGFQAQDQWAVSNDTSGNPIFGVYPDALPATLVQTLSGYVESQTAIDGRLFFNLGGRWEDHSQFGVHTTYQAGLAFFIPGTDTKISANYGTGFLAPSLYQLYDPIYGNPNLQPETSLGYDFGLEQKIGEKNFLKVGADYFDSDLSNLIEFDPVSFVYNNIGRARTYGVESFVEFDGVPNLSVKGNYTYTYAWDLTNNTALIRRPANKAGADLDYQWGRAGWGASFVYVGENLDDDFGNVIVGGQNTNAVVTLPGYFLVNLRASFQADRGVRLFARLDNLFNQYYEELYGYSTAGLSGYIGTKISF